MITKGIVTLNSAYLISPLGVLLMERHEDLFSGDALVPAFRRDKESLTDLIASNEGINEAGITDRRLDEHIARRSEEHTSELQSLMRISYAVFCLKKKNSKKRHKHNCT